MYELYPYFTNDGSVGLFSPEADDIYHSTYGALSEAYEKFVLPADLDNFIETHDEIKILDICYGIGYNTKSFLNYLSDKNFSNTKSKNFSIKKTWRTEYIDKIGSNNLSSSTYNEQIVSDNISMEKKDLSELKNTHESHCCNGTLYSNKISNKKTACNCKNLKIFIKALDIDKNLLFLSPFFKQGKKQDRKHNKLNFHYEKISKLMSNEFDCKYGFKNGINLLLLEKISQKYPEIFQNQEFSKILKSRKYRPFFDVKMLGFFRALSLNECKYNSLWRPIVFLHNIYYNHLSKRYKKGLNGLNLNDLIFEPVIGDARTSILEDSEKYNFVFLDAFTPAKCPQLWSLEFFKLLFEHLQKDGMILTYTNSAAVRNAMINAGFHVGKIYNSEIQKFTGTIAAKDKNLIKYELSEYDLGLINSKAGIFYRDKNLNGLNEAIIATREKEVQESDKISSSRFIKEYKNS